MIAVTVLFVIIGCASVLFLALLVVDWIEPGTREAHELDGYPEPGTVEADADLELMSWDNRAAGDPWPRGVS